jgi:hypothetical protein
MLMLQIHLIAALSRMPPVAVPCKHYTILFGHIVSMKLHTW